ncbi:MAG: CapA family protein [Firmicutes bacterium]|jgi:poly-gamma-glutamate synthesis protein (capsule biosynthesis protein)|nr:CapA family protein [Bacillota bacterium]
MKRDSFILLLLLILFFIAGVVAGDSNPAFATEAGGEQESLETTEEEITVVMVGDLYLSSWLEPLLLKNPAYPYADPGVRELLDQADLVLGNLEAPLSQRGKVYVEKKFTFRCHPGVVATLTAGGFDFVSLANNHIMDYGPEALEDTMAILREHGIAYAGAGRNLKEARKPALLERKGLRIAVLAYNNTFPLEFYATPGRPGTARGVWEQIQEDVQKAAGLADLVIVSFHWSGERVKEPRDYQRSFGQLCIDAGAHVVFGHHPHVHQGVEVYKHGLIAYSLGNFIFASYARNTRDSIILKVRMDRKGLQQAEIYPININNNEVAFQPRLFKDEEAHRLLREIQDLSAALNTRVEIKGDVGVILLPGGGRSE